MAKLWLQSFIFYLVITAVYAHPLAVITFGVGLAGILYKAFYNCYSSECCTDNWVKLNISGLQHDLDNRLFGQHLVKTTTFRVVKGHLTNENPKKALALSFNGDTGCGKNFVSEIIANNLFKKGMDSTFVNLLIATHHFPHKEHLQSYKALLKRWVIGNITKCPRSLFIFDEMDKMPEGLVDVLKPFLDHYPEVEGVDCRKATFIFLSETGASLINNAALENWRKGNDRNAITIKDMDKIIKSGAFNEKGGFWHATLVRKHLIDYFVPFLPLERSHVKKCAKVDLRAKNHSTNRHILDLIADEMQYYPPDSKVFCTSGCRQVSSKVDFIINED